MISIVIPVLQSRDTLARCLAALEGSAVAPLETIVVDDGSSDGSDEVARRTGAVVLRVPGGPRGPAAARNLGAAHARGDILIFLDADVAVHADTLSKFARMLDDHPEIAAVFGSYDDTPAHPSIVSQYRNLLHHYVHQHGAREASTFWAGCSAIRRQAFDAVNGFDEHYTQPSIEDIELGGRLRHAGYRIWLRPEIQATHLKRWTLAGVVRTDIANRAIPWTQLIVSRAEIPRDLNTSLGSRISALAAWIAVSTGFAAVVKPALLLIVLAALAILIGLNASLYLFFFRRRGLVFAMAAAGLHGLYLLYSSATFGVMAIAASVRKIADYNSPLRSRSPL